MTTPIRPNLPFFQPPKPTYAKAPKALKPDVITEYQEQLKRENKLHASWLKCTIATIPYASKCILWLLCKTLPQNLKLKDVQHLKVPKWLPLNVRQAYACEVATFIAKKLEKEDIATLADLSTVAFPDIYCSGMATETLRSAIEAKMNTFLPTDELTIGVYGAEISPLFLDVFNRAQLDHTKLTINAPCDLPRLIQSLTKPMTVRLSTVLDKQLKVLDIQHLIDRSNVKKVIFKRPHAMAMTASLSRKTWENLSDWLNQTTLDITFEMGVQKPRPRPPEEKYAWLERINELKLRFAESLD